MDLGGVRLKMARKNCDRINAVKTVTFFKTLVRRRATGFFQRYGNFILTPTVCTPVYIHVVTRRRLTIFADSFKFK